VPSSRKNNAGILNFSPEGLEQILFADPEVRKPQKIIIAYSGGCDSQVLLHGMSIIARKHQGLTVIAAHYDHGIEENSENWVENCRHWAGQLGVEFVSSSAGDTLKNTANVEALGRELRYRWLACLADPDGVVVTAHHADDQAETFLNRMFRGGDFSQLAGIRSSRPILHGSSVQLIRPLLDFTKQQIQCYAKRHGLDWLDDPSNARNDADRNYLRNCLLPAFYSRGRITRERLIQATVYCRQISQNYERSLSKIFSEVAVSDARSVLCLADPIDLSNIGLDDALLIFGLTRFWLHQSGCSSPTDKQLNCLLEQMKSSSSGYAELSLNKARIRYFDRKLYFTRSIETEIPGPGIVSWKEGVEKLEELGIHLRWLKSDSGLAESWFNPSTRLEFAWQCGQKMVRLPGRSASSMIRKLQQLHRIPSWERRLMPCILHDGHIVWVYGLGLVSESGSSNVQEQGYIPYFFM